MVRIDAETAGGGFILVGLAHLLAPGALIRAARYAYAGVLAADFAVEEDVTETERRVRAIGLLMLAIGSVVAATDRSISVVLHRS